MTFIRNFGRGGKRETELAGAKTVVIIIGDLIPAMRVSTADMPGYPGVETESLTNRMVFGLDWCSTALQSAMVNACRAAKQDTVSVQPRANSLTRTI